MPVASPVTNLIEELRVVHNDYSNAKHWYKIGEQEQEHSSMYLTPFVYQFFMYNTLYQIDWNESLGGRKLKYLRKLPAEKKKSREEQKQESFESFLRKKTKCSDLVQTFKELPRVEQNDKWAEPIPDPPDTPSPERITSQDCTKFVGDWQAFQSRLHNMREPDRDDQLLEGAFNEIAGLRRFVYKVRCNVFHGRKSIEIAREQNQNERIRLYYYFLNGLVNLFFDVATRSCP